ncbi:prion-like-(Q/N-rich) domain-bearing protein 25 [Mercenaria mercenaria]|uniref:prion-like-(Q/N-rich) domain-bearing protein 25 n=1 Tax=Mercenaria mercenaria TaxID=6596 RepID=UPI00234EBEB1|nr:prion-like-(Q/N-rich) domain-bearing protein 25 [Mercenaria mercenaria]
MGLISETSTANMKCVYVTLFCLLVNVEIVFAGLADNCTATTDCAAVNNSICSNSTSQCECSHDYTAEGNSCVPTSTDNGNGTETGAPKALGDACTAHAECNDVEHAECVDDVCTCANGYKEYGIVCIIVLDTPCSSASECTDHLANSKCDTNCVCDTNFTAEQNVCKMGHGMGNCTSVSDCVTNAVCDDSNTCMCEAAFTADNGLCAASGAGSLKLVTDIVLISIILVSLIKLF